MSIDNSKPINGGAPANPWICDLCFDVGKNPLVVYLCFAGIKIGDTWVPGDPDPPNGVHTLTANADCSHIKQGVLTYLSAQAGANSFIVGVEVGVLQFFIHNDPPNCTLWAPNRHATPVGNPYWGGWCMVVPKTVGGSWSLPELMELFDDDQYWAQYINPRPAAANKTFYNIYDSKDKTGVKVLIDHS